MKKVKEYFKKLTESKWFEIIIISVIIGNSVIIGIETYHTNSTLIFIQKIILYIFTFEIISRFIARKNLKSFFKSGWNNFDLFLVLISYIPENSFEGSSALMILRILRIFRVLRLLRTSDEIKLIVAVLSKSFSALFYNGVFFFIFLYLFAIMGVSLFRLPEYNTLDAAHKIQYEKLQEIAPNAPECSSDPYGSLGEAMFTLFRALTGEDWTDLRYNLVKASELGVIKTPPIIITSFHVIWFILAAFLLLNLVVGAIVNNYQIIMEETKKEKEKQLEDK